MKDKRYDLLEERVSQLEDIIDNIVEEVNQDTIPSDEELVTVIPSDIAEEIERTIKNSINLIGIT